MTVYVNVLLSQIRDTESGQDLSDVLTKVKFSCLAWLHDNSGLFYNVSHHTECSVANNNIHYWHMHPLPSVCTSLLVLAQRIKEYWLRGLMRGMANLPQGTQELLVVKDKV